MTSTIKLDRQMDLKQELIDIVKQKLVESGHSFCFSQKLSTGYICYGLNKEAFSPHAVQEPIEKYLQAIAHNLEHEQYRYSFTHIEKEDILYEVIKLKPDGQQLGQVLTYFFDGEYGRYLYYLNWLDSKNLAHREAMIYLIEKTRENETEFAQTPIYFTSRFKQYIDQFSFTLEELKQAFTPYFQNNPLINEEYARFFLARCIKPEYREQITRIIPQIKNEDKLFESSSNISYLVLKKSYLALHYSGLQIDYVERSKDNIQTLLDFIGQEITERHYFGINHIIVGQQWNDYLLSVKHDTDAELDTFKHFIADLLDFAQQIKDKNFANLEQHLFTQNELKTFIRYWVINHNVESQLGNSIDSTEERSIRTSSLKI
jgi:hypothetical protein